MTYICFFHPRIEADNETDLCSSCQHPMNYPSLHLPESIGEFAVEAAIGRGRYSLAVRARHLNTGIVSVLKLTPSAVFEQPDPNDLSIGGHGDRRNFLRECQLHIEVSAISQVARILNWGESDVRFGDATMSISWTQMEMVRGTTLHTHLSGSSLSPQTIAQVASDLLRFSEKMTNHGIHHNDLHGGNVMLVELPPEEQRRQAFEPNLAVKIIDLGSASKTDKADKDRLSDMEQIASHMIHLLQIAEDDDTRQLSSSDVRLMGRLRQVAQLYRRDDWKNKIPSADSMIEAIRHAHTSAIHPKARRATTLRTTPEHYNSQTMPPELARELIYDPDGNWTQNLVSPGPQLVVGMRGCGKTMLLRSLEWAAHATIDPDETPETASSRLSQLTHTGLFVSCAFLGGGARDYIANGAPQRLFLAYAREAIRAAGISEAVQLGQIDYEQVEEFSRLVEATVSSYEAPINSTSLHAIELAISRAILKDIPAVEVDRFIPLESFTSLALAIRRLVDLWEGKTVLFLLDDVSKRYVREDSLAELLTKLCLKSEHFGFKISTETQTQLLRTPSGMPALEGRDYKVFDLGAAVLSMLKSRSGSDFLEQIITRRQRAVGLLRASSPRQLLGQRTLKDIAEQIRATETSKVKRGRGRAKYSYSGLPALAALCVGDIGDVLHIYRQLELAQQGAQPVPELLQSQLLWETSEARLLSLVSLDVETSRFFSHAAAFAKASHNELIKRERLRQISDLFLEIEGWDPSLFTKIMELVDNGIYVIVGFNQRSKGVNSLPSYQFHLKFRKLLGLTHGAPLGNRDRFELTGDQVTEWMNQPSSSRLSTAASVSADWALDWQPEEDDQEPDSEHETPVASTDTSLELSLFRPVQEEDGDQIEAPTVGSRTTYNELPLTEDTLDWEQVTLVAACGFEDRATGSWTNFNQHVESRVAQAILLRYDSVGYYEEVLRLAEGSSTVVHTVDVPSTKDPTELVDAILRAHRTGPLVIDISSMTKPLIYALVKGALRREREIWVLHTAASSYDPSNAELQPILKALDRGDLGTGLKDLDSLTAGEGTAFEQIVVGPPALDASTQSILLFFVTLKHQRVEALLSGLAPDRVVGLRSVHSSGEKSVQSRVIGILNRFLVSSRNGESLKTGSMDAKETFDILLDYHRKYVLDDAYRLEIGLTGTKLQTVGAAMFAAIANPASVYYSVSLNRDTTKYSHGTGTTKLFQLRIVRND